MIQMRRPRVTWGHVRSDYVRYGRGHGPDRSRQRRGLTGVLLKHIPLKDLCALGGWKSPQTVLTSYMHADEDTVRQALQQRRTVRVSGER
jgi:hypothetical protein